MARGRPRKALLSREMIVETALRQIDAGQELNMSRVARELSVHVSSLYNHVEDREGLLEQLRLYLSREYPVPPLDGLSWQDAIRTLATTVHTAYAAHPRLIPLLAVQPISAPEIAAIYAQVAQALLDAGHHPRSVAIAIRMMDSLALGSALVHSDERDHYAAFTTQLAPLDPGAFWADDQALTAAAFEIGLNNLITGLEAELTTPAPTTNTHTTT